MITNVGELRRALHAWPHDFPIKHVLNVHWPESIMEHWFASVESDDVREAVPLEQMTAGEDGWSDWVHPLPGYLMGCCDCGLVHEMEFAIDVAQDNEEPANAGETKAGIITFRARRYGEDDV